MLNGVSKIMRKYSVLAIAAGIAISLVISGVLYWTGNVAAVPREPWPFWYSASKTVGETLLNVMPGVAAGWIAVVQESFTAQRLAPA
jgi:hypothetical protein